MKTLLKNNIFLGIVAVLGFFAFSAPAQAYAPYCSWCGQQLHPSFYVGGYNYDIVENAPFYQFHSFPNSNPYYQHNYNHSSNYYGYSGSNYYGANAYGFYGQNQSRNYRRSDDEPRVETESARDIEEHLAELRGEVDMRDAEDGRAFFIYGEDRDDVEDAEDEDDYSDIDEQGDDLQKVIVDSNLDDGDEEDYRRTVYGLDDDTRIYFRLCVEFEDEDGDEDIECGDVESFRTDD